MLVTPLAVSISSSIETNLGGLAVREENTRLKMIHSHKIKHRSIYYTNSNQPKTNMSYNTANKLHLNQLAHGFSVTVEKAGTPRVAPEE